MNKSGLLFFIIFLNSLYNPCIEKGHGWRTYYIKIYLYVEPVYVKPPLESKDSVATLGPIRFDWTSTGYYRDLAKAYRDAEIVDTGYRSKRDFIVAQLISHLSPESTSLISNVPARSAGQQDMLPQFRLMIICGP
jgi:hypothetical protein